MTNLDCDDLGLLRDALPINGREQFNPQNQQSVAIRGLIEGEHVIDVVAFIAVPPDPLPVKVQVGMGRDGTGRGGTGRGGTGRDGTMRALVMIVC